MSAPPEPTATTYPPPETNANPPLGESRSVAMQSAYPEVASHGRPPRTNLFPSRAAAFHVAVVLNVQRPRSLVPPSFPQCLEHLPRTESLHGPVVPDYQQPHAPAPICLIPCDRSTCSGRGKHLTSSRACHRQLKWLKYSNITCTTQFFLLSERVEGGYLHDEVRLRNSRDFDQSFILSYGPAFESHP